MKILICGVGAIGSNLASLLVPDLGSDHEITILDNDTVEERNVRAGTQFYTRDQIGQSKVEALQYNLYKWYEREVEIKEGKLIRGDIQEYQMPAFSQGQIVADSYDLIIDCLDNSDGRRFLQGISNRTPVLHAGFSDQFTFAIEWNDGYQVPSDITSGLDICEMEGAASFIKMVSSIASLTVQDFLKDSTKTDFIGNRLNVTRVQ